MAQETATMPGTATRQTPSIGTADTGESNDVSRLQRKRAESLRRMCARCGFVREYHVEVGPNGISGHIRAPARRISQSLAPVLRARDFHWTTTQDSDTRRHEGVITIRLSDDRGEGQC